MRRARERLPESPCSLCLLDQRRQVWFLADAVRDALDLPAEYEAQALVVFGYPQAGVTPRPRQEPDLATLIKKA